MHSALVQALRACGRNALAAKPLANTTSRVAVTRRTFLIAASYKVSVAARGYATATATKKKTTAAAKKPAVKKAAPRATKVAAKKKKPAAKATAKAKPKPKTKVKAKAKKPAAKKKPVKRVKKEMSPEKKALLLKRELKKKAMINAEPKQLPTTKWMLFLQDKITGQKTGETGFGDKVKEIRDQWLNLSTADKDLLQERCEENKIQNAANYKKWVESHPILDISVANTARARLIREFEVKINPIRITDSRMPKRPLTSFGQYIKAKGAVFNGTPAHERLRDLSVEWNALSAAQKKPYEDLEASSRTRYEKEMQKIKA